MATLETLIGQARNDDLEAYCEIVHRFQDMAVGYAYSLLGDFHYAEDVAQEAFIEAHSCLPKLRTASSFPQLVPQDRLQAL